MLSLDSFAAALERWVDTFVSYDLAECLITDESRLSDSPNAFAAHEADATEVEGFFAAAETHYLRQAPRPSAR